MSSPVSKQPAFGTKQHLDEFLAAEGVLQQALAQRDLERIARKNSGFPVARQ